MADQFKRYVIVVFVAVAAIFTLDQMGSSSLAQKARRIASQTEQDQLIGSDCSYLKAPENFRGAQARHREFVSRTTEAIRGN
ncbi:MAG: hypothetical protein ACREAM_30790, partial [Blastocatellia bacterium]